MTKISVDQGHLELFKLSKEEFFAFPEDQTVLFKVLEHYQNYFFDKDAAKLNEIQRAFASYYLVDGMINNGGAVSILLESLGEYNQDYLQALELSNNDSDKANFQLLVDLFKRYEDSFMDQDLPAELDEDEEEFNADESDLLENIEEQWYSNSTNRDRLFIKFLFDNKKALNRIE